MKTWTSVITYSVLDIGRECETKEEYIEAINMSGHQNFINHFVKYCLLRIETKRGAVWLWG